MSCPVLSAVDSIDTSMTVVPIAAPHNWSAASRAISTSRERTPPAPISLPATIVTRSPAVPFARLNFPVRSSLTEEPLGNLTSLPVRRMVALGASASELPTTMVSQFLSRDMFKVPEPLANRSVSLPAPPSRVPVRPKAPLRVRASSPPPRSIVPETEDPEAISIVSEPPPNSIFPVIEPPKFTVRLSAPAPRLTVPKIDAPEFTVTAASPL